MALVERASRARRAAQTLLEVIAATTLLGLTVAPALRLLRDALEQSRRIENLEMAATLCVGKLEEQSNLTTATWQEGVLSGDFAAEGQSQLRYQVTKSQSAAEGGLPNRLMAVSVTVWHDVNANAARDATEPAVTLATKVAKMAIYQHIVNNG
jgi:hypothetical protein